MKYTKLITAAILAATLTSCSPKVESASGAERKVVQVQTDSQGWTVEQKNIADRLKIDNQPGSIKHLYIISPYSGQVLIYSTVKGKVSSSGKRLTPTSVAASDAEFSGGIRIDLNGQKYMTSEVLQDDGTYGSSSEYLFWFDSRGKYHQHYPTGGQIIHVSDYPIAVKEVSINLEQAEK